MFSATVIEINKKHEYSSRKNTSSSYPIWRNALSKSCKITKKHKFITTCSQVLPYFCWNCSRGNVFRPFRTGKKQVKIWLQMVMNFTFFGMCCCRCNGAETRKVFQRLAFKFFFVRRFSATAFGAKKTFFAKHVNFYKHLYLDFS